MDNYRYYQGGLQAPARNAAEVTPNDAADLPFVARNLYIGGAGDLTVTLLSGATVTYVGLPAGYEKQGRFKRVHATGTTATDIVAEE